MEVDFMTFRDKVGISLAWLVVIALFAYPMAEIVKFISKTLKEGPVPPVATRESPISTKTPIGRILHAIDTEGEIAKAKTIFRTEHSALPEKIQTYLDRFFMLYDKFYAYQISLDDYIDARYFITASPYLKDYLEEQKYNQIDIYRAQEIIPSTVLRMLYNSLDVDIAKKYRDKAKADLLDLADQYLKSIVEPREHLSEPGAMAICIYVKISFDMATGGFLKDNKEEQFNNLLKRITYVREKYSAMVGEKKSMYQSYTEFLNMYYEKIEKKKNEELWDRWWGKNIPTKQIPHIDKGIKRNERKR